MALSDTDLLLVQRGNVPHKATADQIASYTNSKIEVGLDKDVPIASASQLGVIKVGTNLDIDADGTLNAVIPAGLTYKGTWSNANTPPSPAENGDFYIWDAADSTLNNALWGSVNGSDVTEGDRLFYDGTSWSIISAGGGGLAEITGTAPVVVSDVADGEQDVSMPAATSLNDGYMPKESFAQLESLVSSPGGVASVVAGDHITINTTVTPGTPATPQIGVTENSFIPYDITVLQDLP